MPTPRSPDTDSSSHGDIAAECWISFVGEGDAEIDLRVHGASSLELLRFELDLRRRTGRAVSLETIDGPVNLAAVRQAVARAPAIEMDEDPGRKESQEAPATNAQASQWLSERLRPTHRGYLVPIVIDLPSNTSWAGLSRAMERLVRIHPALRTKIRPSIDDPTELRQVVDPPPRMVVIEPRSVPSLNDDSIAMVIDGLGNLFPSVSSGRPWRAFGLQVEGRLRALLLLVHHVAVDDPSIRILVRDLHRGLVDEIDPNGDGGEEGRRDLLRIGVNEAAAERNDEDLEWWRGRLAGVPDRIPLDAGRETTTGARRRSVCLDSSLVAALDARLIEEGGVRSAAILRAARRALDRVCTLDAGAVPIGVPVSLRDHPSVEETVGMLLNTLPVPVGRNDGLGEIASRVRECRRRRRVPYETIARELPFNHRSQPGRSRWLDLVVGTIEADRGGSVPLDFRVAFSGSTPFPLLLIARFEQDGCRLECDADPSWISDAGADAFLAAVEEELRSLSRGSDSDTEMSTVRGEEISSERMALHDLVSRSAARTPRAIAIDDGSVRLEYAEFQTRIDGLAREILARTEDPSRPIGRPVGILGGPGRDLCISVVAAMRVGGEAMPIAESTPIARIASIISRSRPAAMVVMEEKDRRRMEKALSLAGMEVPILDPDSGTESDAPIPFTVDPDQGCYLLFTSGSTGEPKAVRMHHVGLAGLLDHESRRIPSAEHARTAQFAPVGFDVSFQEMFTTWAEGGTLVPVPEGVRRDPRALARFLDSESIARLHIPPLMLRALAVACPAGFPPHLREIVCAGEALRIDAEVRRAATCSPVRILNQYGPTETHVVTQHDLGRDPDAWPDLPPIGTPIDGVEIRIEAPEGTVLPVGEAGELVVQGAAVALGYLDGESGGFEVGSDGRHRYRTGDLARIGSNGVIEYLGRLDDQVKISGYRVDPAEIEALLVRMDSVAEAAVIAVARAGLLDGHELVAFVVGPEDERALEACLDRLRNQVPSWLVPARIRSVAELPRSANGKIDRSALRSRISDRPLAGRRFGTGLTAGDVLERIEDQAVDPEVEGTLGSLGIDSLAAIRIQEGLALRFGLEMPIASILECTLDDLRSRIGDQGRIPLGSRSPDSLQFHSAGVKGSPPPVDAGDTGWRPLDPLVRDVLAEDALAPEGAFHLAWTITFQEDPGPEEIGRRLAMIRRRHETLRTCRRPELGERLLDVGELAPIDLEAFPGPPHEEERRRILRHPLRLAEGMPWRAATWLDPDGDRNLLLVIHHAAVDGRTARLILDQIVEGDIEIDVVEKSKVHVGSDEIDEQWWVDRVQSVIGDEPLPMIDLDEADRRSVTMDLRGGESFRIAAQEAGRHGMPPITPALLAWGLILGRAAGRSNVIIGLPFATELEEAGLGASILPVAVRVSDETPIRTALKEVAETVAGGLDHRGASLGRIVRRIEADSAFTRPPLDGVITRDDVERRHGKALVRWTSTGSGVFRAGFVVPSTDEGLSTAIDVESAVLDGEDPADLLDRVMTTLGEITMHLREAGPHDAKLGDLDGLTSRQRGRIVAFGQGDSDDGIEKGMSPSIPDRFLSMVESHRDRVAVIDRDETLTYEELSRWSASIAMALTDRCGPINGHSVAVAGPRSAATIASMLGVARAGGWFVPLDPDLPENLRIRQLQSCRPVATLWSKGGAAADDHDGLVLDPHAFRAGDGAGHSDREITGGSPFYAMFTSGTTGEPRGTLIPHRAVHRLVDDAWFLPAGPGFRMLHAAPIAFDASTLEIWWPLLNGGTVCCWEGSAANLPQMHARMKRDRVNGCWLTAALFHAAVDGLPEIFEDLDAVLTGGDVVSPDHVRRLHEKHPALAIIDGYGPTENTVFTACESIVVGGLHKGSIPIGRPIRGTGLRILDRMGHDVPPGRYGELVATGTGLGLGYLDAEGKPEDRDGFQREAGDDDSVYRTGDRVRWRSDGRLEFGGRLDAQVKISGRRIELGAVETGLRRVEEVLDACVVVLEDGDRRTIGALIVPAEGEEDVSKRLDRIRSTVSGYLPAWEIPSRLVAGESIPCTRNGKPDRREVARLLRESLQSPSPESVEPRQDELLAVVCDAIADVAGHAVVEPGRSIRDLGIDSLDLLRLAIELENRVARPVRLVDVLEGGSAAAIAGRIAEDIDREDADLVNLQPGSSSRSRTLYCVPGVGGTVFSFQSILDGLPSWLPVQGLPYPGTAGRVDPLKRVELIGKRFAERILAEGGPPIAILGYSLGGFVAFEAARTLLDHGVGCPIIVIDSAPAGLPSRRSFAARVTSAKDWKMRFRNVLPDGIINRLGGGGNKAIQSLRGVVAAGFEAMRFYAPEPAPIDVVLVRTTETDFGPVADQFDLGWSTLADTVDVIEIPTAHLEVFRGGSMDLARAVRFVVERRRDEG